MYMFGQVSNLHVVSATRTNIVISMEMILPTLFTMFSPLSAISYSRGKEDTNILGCLGSFDKIGIV